MYPFNSEIMKKMISFVSLFLLFIATSFAQQPDYGKYKEKIYIQTSHVFFQPGDEVFFKLYLVNARSQRPSTVSKSVNVEIVDPAGKVFKRQFYKVEDGYTEGSFSFNDDAAGGIYKISAYTTWMRNETDSTFFTKELTLQKVVTPRVLMKLDFPKKGYGPGDEVLADYSARSLSDQPIRNQPVSFKVSIGGKLVNTSSTTTDNEGKAKLTFRLPADLNTNDGLLNVTIDYNAYRESVSRSIPIALNKIDLQLLPEGGTLVAGINANIAFRAVNENGKPADIKGAVLDDAGRTVQEFESYYGGMGAFHFTPEAGKKYHVKIISPLNIRQTYPFPAFTTDGVTMNILKRDGKLLLELAASANQELLLTGETRGMSVYSKHIVLKKNERQILEIDTTPFPAGIARFTLSNRNQVPLAERLVFLNAAKTLHVSISATKQQYLPREKVELMVRTTDESGHPLPANLSLAVMDDKLWTMADDKQDHMLSWLLMSSELKGKIDEPGFYFKKEEPKSAAALDLVMLTHGYRYFDYIPEVRTTNTLKYLPDAGYVVSGVVVNKNNVPVKAAVFLVNTADKGKALKLITDADGVFYFPGLSAGNTYYVLARSLLGSQTVSIRMDESGIGYNKLRNIKLLEQGFGLLPKPGIPELKADAAAINNIVAIDEKAVPVGDDKKLEEVVVIGYGVAKKQMLTGSVAAVTANELLAPAGVQGLLQGRVAGVEVAANANPGAAKDIRLRGTTSLTGNNTPLFVVDGIVFNGLVGDLNPNDITEVTVMKGTDATAIYGSRAVNGVIIISTTRKAKERIRLNVGQKNYYATSIVNSPANAYTVARRFYAPRYASTETTERTDFRETIYWNPVVQTDETGTATITCYNSDATTTFRAIAEGISWDGRAGREEATWSARSALETDAKIPPYLTAGDKVLVPLVLRNNTSHHMKLGITLTTPENISIGKYENIVEVAANNSRQVLIPLEAIARTKGNIRFVVAGIDGHVALSLPIEAAEKGFPVNYTFSGDKSAQHRFVMSQPVKGSVTSRLQVFTSLEGQLLDGIESMLSEPHGCFEQTSSSTYPNILILKYLKESGKSNHQAESKAMDYIEEGYKRLVGFETTEGGFEWFGHTPPHEALTAYGLLEFTDMQSFINVDKNMLNRTKAFLLKRRNGKGGFQSASGGYDRFASVPATIADLYIVYALTQAGVKQEIQKEYESGVARALTSGDAYQQALIALAADNMANTADFDRLMSALKNSYRNGKLPAATTVVNSREVSLRVETMSLFVMALAREKTPEVATMAELVSKILSEKSYYGYGSTQGTVLALSAIVDYVKIKGRLESAGSVSFQLNGQAVHPNDALTGLIRNNENEFTAQYSNNNGIPYSMQVSYYTLQPQANPGAPLALSTTLGNTRTRVGETVRMNITVKNTRSELQPMSIARIGIPAGLSLQPWQLKEMVDTKQLAWYEIFDNYLVLYWMGFSPGETKTVKLDLKADIPGTYKAKAGNCYLYYTPELKDWQAGTAIEIAP
ncbi:A2M domain-containing protein [Chitinophaga sp. 180180018-2]|nr:A2M domain-containing protein [Chitinophaga sp. 212800010-3]